MLYEVITDAMVLKNIRQLKDQLAFLDSLALQHARLGKLLFNSRHLISAHLIGGRKLDYLFISQPIESIGLRNNFV